MSLGAIGPNTGVYEPIVKVELPPNKRKEGEDRVESARKNAMNSEKTPDREIKQREHKRESSYDRHRSHRSSPDGHRHYERKSSSHRDERKSYSRRDDDHESRYDKKRQRSPVADDRRHERRDEPHSSSNKLPRTKEPECAPKPVTHSLPMSGVVYLDNIKRGIKTHEGRICRGTVQKMRAGDVLILRDNRAGRGIQCEITSCTRYNSFKDMLVSNGVLNMLPQLAEFARRATPEALLDEGVRVYQGFPGSQDVARLGVVAIGVKFIKDC